MENEDRLELTYCEDIEHIEGNILKVPANLLEVLEKEEQIIVEGKAEDQFIFTTGDNSFKMRGIYLPTTMMVTPALGTTVPYDNSNSEGKPSKPTAKILLETTNYLKIESHHIEFQRIFSQIAPLALGENLVSSQVTLNNILENEGITVSELTYRYKITQKHIEKMAKAASITFFRLVDDDEVLAVQLTYSFMAAVLRQMLPVLTSKNLLTSFFSYSELSTVPIIDIKFLEVIARYFAFESNPPLYPPSPSLKQMEMQRQFKVTLDTIIKFVVVEMMLVKKQYVKEQMDELMANMLVAYLPVGDPDFSETKVKERLPEIIAQHFVTVSRGGQHIVRTYYDPLTVVFNIKARVQEMSGYKKKFTKAEIYGFFSLWYTDKEIDDIILKNFRKMGKQYQIKLLIPK